MPGMIPITKVGFGPEDLAAVQRVLESGWLVQGREVQKFEESIAEFCGVPHAVAATSCSTSLHLALKALDVGPGDEVIVPAFTWISTASSVEHCGARPVFCDISLDTFNIDIEQVESLITPRTVGLLPVHLFGLCTDLRQLQDISDRHGLWMLEDAACALGSKHIGHAPGQTTAGACFSFHPRKSLTTGEGGMLVTRDTAFADRCRRLRNHGAQASDFQRHQSKGGFRLATYPEFGFNFRMTDLQASIGNSQFNRIDELLEGRRRCATLYDNALAELTWLTRPAEHTEQRHSYQSYVCLFSPETPQRDLSNLERLTEQRTALQITLEEHGVMTRQGTHAPILLDCFATKYKLQPEDFPQATIADSLSIALPLYPGLSSNDLQTVVDELKQFGAAAGLPSQKQRAA